MALSNQQIERYSRQIILPQVGGLGQERLLAARIAIAGEIGDLESPLAYLVGAGVGTILLNTLGDNDNARCGYLIGQMRDLNPEIKIDLAAPGAPAREPTLILIGSARARDAAQTANAEARIYGLIAARLDNPGEIVIAPVRPPCLACAGETLAIFGTKSETAELVKMMAATEAIKYLVQPDATAATIIKFDRLASRTETLRERANCAVCTGSG